MVVVARCCLASCRARCPGLHVCFVRTTGECGCVVSLCFLFFIYCVFCFICNVIFVFYFVFFMPSFVWHFACVVRGRYVLTRVVCVRLCRAHD